MQYNEADNPDQESPRTPFERFQQCFRNMGVVVDFYPVEGSDDQLVVRTNEQGMDVSLVREKGHDFELVQTYLDLSTDEPELVHIFRYLGGDDA